MVTLSTLDPTVRSAVSAIRAGRVQELRRLLAEHPDLATARLGDDDPDGMSRALLHLATDWPGHYPHVAESIHAIVEAGADLEARFRGPHRETALHWAASSDDLDALNALLDAGADIDAEGGVIAGGTPLRDATAFGQWDAARVLVDRGARATPADLAALGMTAPTIVAVDGPPPAPLAEVNHAFWSACHGNQLDTARALAERGAEIDWVPGWEAATALDIAARVGAHEVLRWLHSRGAHTWEDLRGR